MQGRRKSRRTVWIWVTSEASGWLHCESLSMPRISTLKSNKGERSQRIRGSDSVLPDISFYISPCPFQVSLKSNRQHSESQLKDTLHLGGSSSSHSDVTLTTAHWALEWTQQSLGGGQRNRGQNKGLVSQNNEYVATISRYRQPAGVSPRRLWGWVLQTWNKAASESSV